MFREWFISAQILESTQAAMQSGRHEVFAIWTAELGSSEGSCTVRRTIVPKQNHGRSAGGVFVHIEGSELQRIQLDNFQRSECSVVQLHTHPSADVRMSDLDREWEVVRHPGALSIIVPNYCSSGFNCFVGSNVYERNDDGWRLWDPREIATRFKFL